MKPKPRLVRTLQLYSKSAILSVLARLRYEGCQNLMIKLLMCWDIKPGRENEFFEFIMREFAPDTMKMGLRTSEVWYTIYGGGPQMQTEAVAEDIEKMREIINSSEWEDLQEKLLNYVTNFRQKVVPYRQQFQIF